MNQSVRNTSPRVSVITPCLDGVAYLPKMVESLRAQTFADWELVFVDDGSTDGSLEYMQAAALTDTRIIVKKSEGRVGTSRARNIGLSFCRGRYVAFLDSDDWWLPNKLSRQLEVMEKAGAAFSCTSYRICDQEGQIIRTQRASGPLTSKRHLRKDVVIGCLTVMVDRAYLPSASFRSDLKRAEDYVLWYELLVESERRGVKALIVDEPLACYRVHLNGKSKNKLKHAVAHWYIYRRALGLAFTTSVGCLLSYAINGVLDRIPGFSNLDHYPEELQVDVEVNRKLERLKEE